MNVYRVHYRGVLCILTVLLCKGGPYNIPSDNLSLPFARRRATR